MTPNRLVSKINSVAIALFALSTILLFQNCAPSGGDSQQASAKGGPPVTPPLAGNDSGNGYGYGGKPFVKLLASGLCADGSNIEAQINQGDGNFILVREYCANLATPHAVAVQLGATADIIIYNGAAFVGTTSSTPTPTPTPPTQPTISATIFAGDAGSVTLGGGCPTNAGNLKLSAGNVHAKIICDCNGAWTANGIAYGSGPFWGSTSICRSALHAGIITSAGGTVTFYLTPAASNYTGTLRNGVQSMDYTNTNGDKSISFF